MNRVPIFIVLALCASFPAGANELQMIVSGRSIHLGANDLNENNYGFGLQYDFAPQRRWIPLINMASLKDSNGNTSKYIGAGMKRRFKLNSGGQRLRFDLGAAALVMQRPDYNDDQPFLAALPFVALSNDWGGINVTYVPSIEENALSFWYLQFAVKLLEF